MNAHIITTCCIDSNLQDFLLVQSFADLDLICSNLNCQESPNHRATSIFKHFTTDILIQNS